MSDPTNTPSSAMSLLNSLQPILSALTADNVNPLAVIQLEAVGACFHLNGPFADKVPELLRRAKSMRLERISCSVSWHAGDTAATMAQTSGGRAVAVLSLILVEIYGKDSTGKLYSE